MPKHIHIMDCGGGDSMLVDRLLAAGFTEITVLDISEAALEKARLRLGSKASLVNWVVSDVLDYNPDRLFSLCMTARCFIF